MTYDNQKQILKDQLDASQKELKEIEDLKARYPNLEITVNRWKTKYISSTDVNQIVTNIETKHDCGCCSDSSFYVYLYMIDQKTNKKIYSSPYRFIVGELADWKPSENTFLEPKNIEKALTKHNISKPIIEKIVKWMKASTELNNKMQALQEEYENEYKDFR